VSVESPTPAIDLVFPHPRRFQLKWKDLQIRSTDDLLAFGTVVGKEYDLPELMACIEVGSDLFEPLGVVRLGGRRYSSDDDQVGSQAEPYKAPAVSVGKSGYRQSFTVRESQGLAVETRQKMSIWDLIFPLLEPPISFDFDHFIGLPSELYAFQRDGVRFLAEAESGLLGDDMGMGKTVQCIVAMRLLFQSGQVNSALLVVPLALLANWQRELERWAPTLSGVTVVHGPKVQRGMMWRMPAHIWVATYGVVRNDIDEIVELRDFDLVVVDEIQNVKNPSTAQTSATRALPRMRAWGLSGTPLENSLDDLVSIYDFLKPGLLPREGTTPASVKRAIEPYFLRRRKSDFLHDLPAKTAFDQWVALEGPQWEAYDLARRDGVVFLKELGEEVTVQHVLALLTRLKMICNRDPGSGKSAKLELLEERLDEVAEADSKALVFSQFLDEGVFFIRDHFTSRNPVAISGGQTPRERQHAVDRFQNDPDCRLLIATPKAGGIGLNLVAGNYVFHFDHWWNPATARQAEDRAHRIGQTKEVFVYHLWTERTVEERIRAILEAKQKLYDDVIDGLSNVESTGLSEEELFGLFELESPKQRAKRASSGQSDEEILDKLLGQSPTEFEQTVKRLYDAWGFRTRLTPATRDLGVDVLAFRNTAGGGTEKIAVQCKRHSLDNPVGTPDVRNLLGTLNADLSYTKGVLVTTSRFSRDARDLASKIGRLDLVDGRQLSRHLNEADVRV
jgi:SNF2 family DNA or RNA helicase